MKVKPLELKSLPGEAEVLSSNLVLVINEHELQHEVTGLCVDNCNIDFGKVKEER
jgi:hypothetical protein